ncbi:17854_t:CDS:2 [Funneliformis geosporum]|uniref:17854_t:CDS:1 n=1 Tax=Funneliformis geosporum TaxID=1117311 RepID=A0A9W4SKL8_9GLOM|nr:17854_t:CDS:2 [Funneliformis geosporum]
MSDITNKKRKKKTQYAKVKILLSVISSQKAFQLPLLKDIFGEIIELIKIIQKNQ